MDHRIFEGILHGLFGGLFGPAIAQWLSRFKYWVIFLIAVASTYIGFFFAGIYAKGLKVASQIMLIIISAPEVFFLSIGVGIFAVFVAFMGSLNAPQESKKDEQDKNKLPR